MNIAKPSFNYLQLFKYINNYYNPAVNYIAKFGAGSLSYRDALNNKKFFAGYSKIFALSNFFLLQFCCKKILIKKPSSKKCAQHLF